MSQRIRVNTESLKKYAEIFQRLADNFVSTGAKVFKDTIGLPDYNGQLPTKTDAMRTQLEANSVGMEMKADSERLIALADLFDRADSEAVGGFIHSDVIPPSLMEEIAALAINAWKTTSQCGVSFIARHEDVDKPIYPLYNDAAGNCTGGIGHRIHMWPCCGCAAETPYKNMPKEEAQAQLAEDVKVAEDIVKKSVKVPLTQAQFDALVSFVYNLGRIYDDVLAAVNAGDFETAGELMKNYVYGSDGVRYGGLVNRRNDEAGLMNTGMYGNEFCDDGIKGFIDGGRGGENKLPGPPRSPDGKSAYYDKAKS